jgi:CRP-like cAMP-binding protein
MKSHFEAGDRIFSEGDPANRFYLLKNGKVVR